MRRRPGTSALVRHASAVVFGGLHGPNPNATALTVIGTTGGAYGPEAGVAGLVGRVLALLLVLGWLALLARKHAPAAPSATAPAPQLASAD